jgi:hypothetical protein
MQKSDRTHKAWLPCFLLILPLLAVTWAVAWGVAGSRSSLAQAGSCPNLISDSSFSSGTGWEFASQGTYSLLSNYMTHSGPLAAHLAGVDNAADQLSTTVTLPAGGPVTLHYWWMVQTAEAGAGADSLTVRVFSAGGDPLATMAIYTDQDEVEHWQQASFDLSAYAGQPVQLHFDARTDGSLPSDFFIDDVTVEACGNEAGSEQIFLPLLQQK